MASDTETLKQAIVALYSPTSSEQQRGQANQWLMTFASSPAAWEAARALLAEPDENVQYFGANLLFMKVRSEWHSLATDMQASIYSVVGGLVTQLAVPPPPGQQWSRLSAAGKRLCLVLAAAAVRSNALEAFTSEALKMASDPTGAAVPVGLELLIALPQELIERNAMTSPGGTAGAGAPAAPPLSGVLGGGPVEMARSASSEAVLESRPELRAYLPQIIEMLVCVLSRHGGVGPHSALGSCAECVEAVLRCLQHWLSLGMGCSLLFLLDSAPSLVTTAMQNLANTASPSEKLAEVAADALVELLTPGNTSLTVGKEKDVACAVAVADQLGQMATALRISEAVSAEGGLLDERQYQFCRVLCAFAERAVDVVAVTDGRLLQFVQLMFCVLGGELRAAELTIDFWTCLQDTPLAQRHEQLRAPLYRELQQRVMAKCMLPQSFTSWDEEDDLDQDEFERFREQSAVEVLSTCLQLMHSEFIQAVNALIASESPSWQSFELVFFIIRSLHAELKATLNADADGAELPAAMLAAHKDAVRVLLSRLLAPAGGDGSAFAGQPSPLLTSAVRLYGSFGKWMAKEQPQMTEGCVRCVLQALRVEGSAEHAAIAFKNLCVHAQRQLGRLETILALLSICEPSIRDASMSADLRISLMEGLARLVGSLSREEAAQQALEGLVAPLAQMLEQAVGTLPQPTEPPARLPKEVVESCATLLSLVSSAIRFCDGFKPERHPVYPVLSKVWPTLMEVGMRCRGEPLVVQAMCELYSRAMGTLNALIRPLLPQLLQHVVSAFQTCSVVGCLTTLRDAIERFGKAAQHDTELRDMLSQVMTVIITHTCGYLSSSADPEAQPELLTAFWEMNHRCLVFQPGLLLSLPCAPQLFEAAIGCVRHQEFQHTRAVLTFICLFMCPTESANEFRETSAICLQTQGARLLRECLSGLASVSPDNLVDHQVELMRVLIEACPAAVQTWLTNLLGNPQSLSLGSVVDPQGETMRTFAKLVLQQPALPQGEFQCVASDFSRICRGRLGADALNRYVQKFFPAGAAS